MAKAKIQHTYPCEPARFWSDILFDQAFNRQLFIEHLKFKQWKVEKLDDGETELRRTLIIQPVTGELPTAVAKLVGDNLGFREEGVFDKKAERYRFNIIPNRLADKLSIRGEIYVEPRGEGRCERFVDLDVEAKIFGLGGVVEKRIIADTRDSYDKSFSYAVSHLNKS